MWLPIDVNLWERDGWFIARIGMDCFWMSIPGAEFGPFASFDEAMSAVEDMHGK